jgi:hypothetical protein
MIKPRSGYVLRLRHFKNITRERPPLVESEFKGEAVSPTTVIPKDTDDEGMDERLTELASRERSGL